MANNNEEFDAIVYDAAGGRDAGERLASHGHLIDVPNPHEDDRIPMHTAAKSGHAEAIEMLVRHGSKAVDARDRSGFRPLHTAAFHQHVEAVEMLLRLGSQAFNLVNDQGVTAMRRTVADAWELWRHFSDSDAPSTPPSHATTAPLCTLRPEWVMCQ